MRVDMPKIQIPLAAFVSDNNNSSPSGSGGKGANPFFGGGSSSSLPLRKYSKQSSYFPPAQVLPVQQQQQQQPRDPRLPSPSPSQSPDALDDDAPFLSAESELEPPRDSVYSMSSKSAYSDLDSPFEFGQYLSSPTSPVGTGMDYRLEPRPDESDASLMDNMDYSRRVLRVTNGPAQTPNTESSFQFE